MDDHDALLQHLLQSGETSFASTLEGSVPKIFLVASASWLEDRAQSILRDFFSEVAGDRFQAFEFVRIRALDRQFHTLFSWGGDAPLSFFAAFGRDMKAAAKQKMAEDESFATTYRAFLELGNLRNQVVHQNYADFILEKTAAEVRTLFTQANKFLDTLPRFLRQDLARE